MVRHGYFTWLLWCFEIIVIRLFVCSIKLGFEYYLWYFDKFMFHGQWRSYFSCPLVEFYIMQTYMTQVMLSIFWITVDDYSRNHNYGKSHQTGMGVVIQSCLLDRHCRAVLPGTVWDCHGMYITGFVRIFYVLWWLNTLSSIGISVCVVCIIFCFG